jgi:predicted nucleic acid-binding protein
VLCDVVLAEVCTALKQGSDVLQFLEDAGLVYLPIEAKAALRAGEMQRRYRQRGGRRERTIPDFLVGAHALLQCDGLITFDAGFFRDYFKGLKVIVPSA